MLRLGPLAAQHAGAFAHDLRLGSPAALVAFAVVATVGVAAVPTFGCAKGAKKLRRQDNNNVYYYGQGYPSLPPAGAYGYPPQQPAPGDAGKKQGRMGGGAGLALGAGAGLATGVIGSALSSGCGGCGGGCGG